MVYKRSNIELAKKIAARLDELRAIRSYASRCRAVLFRGASAGAMPGNWADSDHSPQQLRFDRFLMAAASSLMVIFLLGLCWWERVLAAGPFVFASIAILVCIVAFYGLFRSGLNKKMRDPSLTVPMILASTSVISYVAYHLNEDARGVFLLVYLVSMLFGVFRLGTRKLLLISLYVLCSYGAVIWLLTRHEPTAGRVHLETLQWMILANVLIWFSLMGGYIRELHRSAGEALRKSEAHFRSVAESANDAIISADNLGCIVFWNKAAEKTFGYTQEEVLGQPLTMLMPERYWEAHLRGMQHFLTTGEARVSGKLLELAALHKDGTEFPIDLSLASWRSRQEIFFTAILRDITERKRAAEKLSHFAQHDFLTDLPNQVLLTDRLDQAIALAHRQGKRVGLLFLDLDHFKHINDSLGHAIGDRLLQSVAQRLVGCVRGADTVCRQGGDEFLILLAEIEDTQDAANVAEKLLAAVTVPHFIDLHELHITSSIGISVYPDDGVNAETVIKNADIAMYHAKASGRNNYQFFTGEMNARALKRHSLENNLRRAVKLKDFVLHYQPKVNLETGRITGTEALIRWLHPHLGLIPPAQFVPMAEASGLIVPLGQWVLREACEQVRAWLDAGLLAVPVAVNISMVEFNHKSFLEGVHAILKNTGLEPRYLELELTESVLMQHTASTVSMIEALKTLGVQLAMDDFGMGYSSLNYLRHFQIDCLKIDQSFISEIPLNANECAITKAIIALAKSLKVRVTAEGIEKDEQLAFLRAYGCDEGQGYYLGKPMVARDFEALLNRKYASSHQAQ